MRVVVQLVSLMYCMYVNEDHLHKWKNKKGMAMCLT